MSTPFGEIEVADERFRGLTLPVAPVRRVFEGTLWAEGPVYFPLTDTVIWSDIPNDRMMQYVEGSARACSATPRTTRTATRATARVGSSPASTSPAA